jgi:hypothetical protein
MLTSGWSRRRLELEHAAAGSDGPLCLVHLVRKAHGLAWLREFAEALRAHPPGTSHELVLAMKGFASAADAAPYLELLSDLAPEALFFPDRGFDLGVYFAAAARLRRDRYCFVNSHSRPLVEGWLAKLDAALDRAGVGQVGAMGAWTSNMSSRMYSLGLPSAYRSVMPPRSVFREVLGEIREERVTIKPLAADHHPIRLRLRSMVELPEVLLGFPSFPAPHLHSNAFVIKHAALRELELPVVRSKMDTSLLESGRRSITRQLRKIGMASLVVDRAGSAFGPDEWDRSRTFWQADQEGLLVADNQSLSYTHGDLARRRLLSASAWGPRADPLPPSGHSDNAAARAS